MVDPRVINLLRENNHGETIHSKIPQERRESEGGPASIIFIDLEFWPSTIPMRE